MSLVFRSEDGRQCLVLSPEAVAVIQEQTQRKHPHETGGILVGYYDESYRLATAVLATPPPPDSKHGPTTFERGVQGIKELLADCKAQNPSLHYLGEWHTHPKNRPSPSGVDTRQMQCFALRRLYGASSPLLLIVGGVPPGALEWRAFIHRPLRKSICLELL